jgi:hypothetical protein
MAENRERVSIERLERMLDSESGRAIEILPNGEIHVGEPGSPPPKILTLRENLGGEYGG